ncbi:MAG TPA: DNA polymerase III subunit gamma/tau [Candidatus Syntrophosphaera sp.]|jgi:DNA polymerase-3 subunit gamma/tau|nr:DNA polymerase III subunit gamma/tau [Candidatus Syntrophosphaera sp.]HPH61306.1 DNA polymerase III subunit gamma/tau [Candidatus Syntrophosphaera sp.]
MSYIVLARKYRPQTFSEVYAQEHITEILHNAILSNRIAHAYLFTGPRGVGKTSMARILAKNLNCVEGPTVTPCNKCHNCLEIAAGTSSDVIEIDGASNTGVDDIRELQRELLYAPSQSPWKIYIIDEVHMLSKSAFNALLKTLEEPPENVLFIFATTEPFKVPATIISRCQRYDFKRIPIDSIVKRLKELMREENIEIDAESLHMIARKADGSLRDALSLTDQVLSYCQNKVSIDKVREIFGLIPTQIYCELLRLIQARENSALLERLQSIFEEGVDLQEFLNNMMEFVRIVILRKIGMSPSEVTSEEYPLYDEIAALFSRENLLYIMSMLMQARNEIKSSGNPYLIFELMMLKLCKLDEMEDVAQLIAKLSSGTVSSAPASISLAPAARPAPTPGPEKKPEPARTAEPAPSNKLEFNQANLDKVWDRIKARVKKESSTSGIALGTSSCEVKEGFKLLLKVTGSTNFKTLADYKDEITKILAEFFTQTPRLELEQLASEAPTKVEIKRQTLEDLKNLDKNLARFIEITDSKLSQ